MTLVCIQPLELIIRMKLCWVNLVIKHDQSALWGLAHQNHGIDDAQILVLADHPPLSLPASMMHYESESTVQFTQNTKEKETCWTKNNTNKLKIIFS
jgi:hypothetical protein